MVTLTNNIGNFISMCLMQGYNTDYNDYYLCKYVMKINMKSYLHPLFIRYPSYTLVTTIIIKYKAIRHKGRHAHMHTH